MSAHLDKVVTQAMEHVSRSALSGDYYEFGIYAGYIFYHAQRESLRLGLADMHFWGFDSFQGLPEVSTADRAVGFETGAYACDRAIAESLLSRFGVDWSRSALIEGWYADTLTSNLIAIRGMRPAAVIVVDCDIYLSTVPVLRFMAPLLQSGTVIIFDDWNCFKEDEGEKRAFREFMDAHPEWTTEDLPSFDWCDRSFIMRLK